jgi:spermidine/putrescine-binding protein
MTDFRMSRRDLLRAGAGAAALSSIPSLSEAAVDEMRVLFPGGSWKEYFERVFANDFAKKENVKFNWRAGHRFTAIVIAQRRNPQWDLMHSNQTDAMQLGTMGLLSEWKEDRIPHLKDVHEAFRYPYLAGKVHTPYGLCVNTKRITRKIDSWNDLWDPEFAGKVAFPDWGWVGEELFHAVNLVFGGTEENVDPGIAKFKELYQKNKAKVGKNVDEMMQLFVNEELWIAPLFSARTMQARQKGAPVEFVIPKEGGMSWIYQTGLIANRSKERTEMSERLVDFTLDPERQIEFSKLTGYPPTNKKAIANIPPDRKDLMLTENELQLLAKLQSKLDYMAMFGYRDQYRERWQKEVLGS